MDYVIATVPRSGSTMLCDLLARNGAGQPAEHLNPEGTGGFAAATAPGLSTEAYLEAERAAAGAILGTKLMVHWLPAVRAASAELAATDASLLRRLFPGVTYVRLRRRDVVGMAISHALAMATGEWQGPRRDRPTDRQITMTEVDQHLRWLQTCEDRWTAVLGELGVTPYEVTYEELLATPGPTLVGLLKHLGVPGEVVWTTAATTVQRGAAAADLRRRYERWIAGTPTVTEASWR